MRPDLSTAHFYGVPFVHLSRALDIAIGNQVERRRLIQPAGIRLPEHSRRSADGHGYGMAGDTEQHNNFT